ncbi:MAG: ATP-binding protein [Bacteroidales bacterium]|nr:ATP-binding protein [Bacteroidales bacterium]
MRGIGRKHTVKEWLAGILSVLGLLIVLYTSFFTNMPGDTESAARRVERRLNERMEMLEDYAGEALDQDDSKWMTLKGLPSDMVVYRYVRDTLQSWANRFTLANDDITPMVMFEVIGNPRSRLSSPLADVTQTPSFMNLGQQWYITKRYTQGDVQVVAGLMVTDMQDERHLNGVNPVFRLEDKYSIRPIAFSGGTPVAVGDIPQFKVITDVTESSVGVNFKLLWGALGLLIAAMFLLLVDKRSLLRYFLSTAVMLLAIFAMYIRGMFTHGRAILFSPVLYADGPFFYSLGAVVLVNMAMQVFIANTFCIRRKVYKAILSSSHRKTLAVLYSLALLSMVAGVIFYTHAIFESIIENSNICLELYKFKDLSAFTALVYGSFTLLLTMLVLLIQMLKPAVKIFFDKSLNAFSITGRLIVAAAMGIYFTVTPAVHGSMKEDLTASMWADRLSIDRDISLELMLRRAEAPIAEDVIIASLSYLKNSNLTIVNRIAENYLSRMTQSYDMSVYLFDENDKDPAARAFLEERAMSGVQIDEGSRFRFVSTGTGYTRYSGIFTYFDANYGVSHMVLNIEPRANKESTGYASILNLTAPGQVVLPTRYSYAKYNDTKLVTYRGSFAYPTVITDDFVAPSGMTKSHNLVKDGYLHRVNSVSDDEVVIISHKTELWVNYVVSAFFIAVLVFLILTLSVLPHSRRTELGRNYYRSRISYVLVVSLVLTLVTMASLSVYFVYQRNNANKALQMSDRINAIQAMLEPECRLARDFRDLATQDFSAFMEGVSAMSKTDITLYTPDGKAFSSTFPEVFERLLLSDRIDQDAFKSIVYDHERYHINHEQSSGKKYYSLYAPLFNAEGNMVAIVCSPFTDETYDFEMDAFSHTAAIVTIFLILLLVARFTVSKIVDRLFKPLGEMGRKMNTTDVEGLEYITYDRDDEITTIVDAYNRMVHDLSESTRQLAQAERDKAWSLMARQVAHDIKNPLTPMQLQIQRVQRLKARGVPGWEDKFDEMVKLLLDHIEILSDTANQFSTLAKLNDEPMTPVDLDGMLQEEISMFDSKDNISFEYLGLEGVQVMAPRPQLTRVFVNLLVNSVQAIEGRQKEMEAAGEEVKHGLISVSLRNSSDSGFYDIVFEDNGQGVSEANIANLFTPNFTTKSNGSGLGLAICRSILEKCGGEISYSKSFALGGACFTIKYPKS